jgi:hypothetical protein
MIYDYVPLKVVVEEDEPETLAHPTPGGGLSQRKVA